MLIHLHTRVYAAPMPLRLIESCQTVSTRRCATKPFVFSDGTKVNVGDWACTPVRAIMQNEQYYPDPLVFQGFRFAPPEALDSKNITGKFQRAQEQPSNLVDVDHTWHVWGTGRMAWFVTAPLNVSSPPTHLLPLLYVQRCSSYKSELTYRLARADITLLPS